MRPLQVICAFVLIAVFFDAVECQRASSRRKNGRSRKRETALRQQTTTPAPVIIGPVIDYMANRRNKESAFKIRPPKVKTTFGPKKQPSTTPVPVTTTTEASKPDAALKQKDIFDLSSSDLSPSIAWPVPRKPASKRFRAEQLPFSSTQSPLLAKLRAPKPQRPLAYSLDGFVPKPAMIQPPAIEQPARHQQLLASSSNTNTKTIRSKKQQQQNKKYKSKNVLQNELDSDGDCKRFCAMGKGVPRKGVPGVDYPAYQYIPQTDFSCDDYLPGGMYADKETGCQVWHMCMGGPTRSVRHSFVCAQGTVFNEKRGVCDWWYNVQCV